MTRQEFITTLRDGLKKLPPEEIAAATEYYEEYFDEVLESGEKTEAEILDELGSPKRIAARIRAEYAARILGGEVSALGEKPTTKKKLSAAWWVVIGIVAAPLSIPALIGAMCLLVGAICVLAGLVVAIINIAIAGASAFVFGFVALFDAFSSGIMSIGMGMVAMAIAAAAGFGLFIGVREAVRAIAKTIRNKREKRRIRNLSEESAGRDGWVYVSRPDEDEEAFMREMEADAAEAAALDASELEAPEDATLELEAPEETERGGDNE